jgi:integrase
VAREGREELSGPVIWPNLAPRTTKTYGESADQLTPVLDDAGIKAILKVCAGREFADFRDTAIVRLFLDTGMRLDVLAKLRVDDVNLDCDNLHRPWQGHGPRVCPFGTKTAQALDATSARDRARSERTSQSSYWAARTRRRRPSP